MEVAMEVALAAPKSKPRATGCAEMKKAPAMPAPFL
jgi:hypothetical protein